MTIINFFVLYYHSIIKLKDKKINKKRLDNKVKFKDYDAYISICGAEDKNLKILENKFNVSIYPKGNELTIEGNYSNIEDTLKVIYILKDMYISNTEISLEKVINISDNVFKDKAAISWKKHRNENYISRRIFREDDV